MSANKFIVALTADFYDRTGTPKYRDIGLSLLAEHPAGNQPRTHALVALMLLNAARLPARTDSEGNILRLKEQDRSIWNQVLIARGMQHLSMSAAGDELSAYHLQAGIAACHCAASDYESTDWPRILSLYDRLLELDDSPVIFDMIRGRDGVDQVAEVRDAAHLIEPVASSQLLGDSAGVGRNARVIAGEHGLVDLRVTLHVEVLDLEPRGDRHNCLAVEQDGAKRRLLGLDIVR